MQFLAFEVDGQAAPQGSKRHVGDGVMVESSEEVGPWRDRVLRAARAAAREALAEAGLAHWVPLDGELRLDVTFWLIRPGSAPKTRDVRPIRKPDLSKIIRSTEDALTDAGIIADDARIVTIFTEKRYAVHAGLPKIFDPEKHRQIPGAQIRIAYIEP